MFAGFNLTLNSMDLIELSAYKEQGDQLFKEQKKRNSGSVREIY